MAFRVLHVRAHWNLAPGRKLGGTNLLGLLPRACPLLVASGDRVCGGCRRRVCGHVPGHPQRILGGRFWRSICPYNCSYCDNHYELPRDEIRSGAALCIPRLHSIGCCVGCALPDEGARGSDEPHDAFLWCSGRSPGRFGGVAQPASSIMGANFMVGGSHHVFLVNVSGNLRSYTLPGTLSTAGIVITSLVLNKAIDNEAMVFSSCPTIILLSKGF